MAAGREAAYELLNDNCRMTRGECEEAVDTLLDSGVVVLAETEGDQRMSDKRCLGRKGRLVDVECELLDDHAGICKFPAAPPRTIRVDDPRLLAVLDLVEAMAGVNPRVVHREHLNVLYNAAAALRAALAGETR